MFTFKGDIKLLKIFVAIQNCTQTDTNGIKVSYYIKLYTRLRLAIYPIQIKSSCWKR